MLKIPRCFKLISSPLQEHARCPSIWFNTLYSQNLIFISLFCHYECYLLLQWQVQSIKNKIYLCSILNGHHGLILQCYSQGSNAISWSLLQCLFMSEVAFQRVHPCTLRSTFSNSNNKTELKHCMQRSKSHKT
ncbi:unnamed protein product [Ixodes persulcatus]